MGDTAPQPRSIALDAATSVVARVLAMAASSATAIVVAASLAKAEYGAWALATGVVTLLMMALDIGLTSSLARFVAQGRAVPRLVAAVVVLRLGIVSTGALLVLVVSVVAQASGSGDRLWELMPATAMLLVAQSLVAFHFGSLPAMRRIRLLVVVTVLQPLLELAGVATVLLRGGDARHVLYASAGAALVAALVGYVALAIDRRGFRHGDHLAAGASAAATAAVAQLRDVLHYGRQLFLVSLLVAVFGQVDQFVVWLFHDTATVAPYALALKMQALVCAPAITITGIVAPRIAGAGADALRLYRRWLGVLACLHLGGVAILAVLPREAFGAINPDYRGDWGILLAMLPFLLLAALAPLPSVTLNQTGHARSRLRIAAVTVAINLALDLALVPWAGAYGAAIGTTVAFAWYLWAHHAMLERVLLADGAHPAPGLVPVVARGALLAVAAAALAAAVAQLVPEQASARADDLVTLLAAGTVATVALFAALRWTFAHATAPDGAA